MDHSLQEKFRTAVVSVRVPVCPYRMKQWRKERKKKVEGKGAWG